MVTPSASPPRTSDGAVALEVEGLAVDRADRPVLEGVGFSVRQRESLVVLGSSGSGKSTLLRTLIGLETPREGSVRLLGQDLHALAPPARDLLLRKVGVAFQGSALLGSLTVGENVALPLREHTTLDRNTVRIMTRMKLGQVGLDGFEDRLPAELSGGQRKRAGIARALAMDPPFLFLDEPSAGLDPITSAGLDELLRKLQRALGLTLVVVTHELQLAAEIADHVILLERGRIHASGTFAELRVSDDVRVRQFFERRPDRPVDRGESVIDALVR